ncbi:MAG: FecR family protein, partial [Verrucomicrobiae bacterium]|nr:FecR family protein [Verrucomicrobiae bacterium]NNJ87160.1 FecR domain-containing protein [Akkermansiaceae bacterium]
MKPSELENRILSLLDGQLPPEEVKQLEAHLRADKSALQAYFKLVQLHNALDYKYSQAPSKHILIDKILAAQKRRNVMGSLIAAAALLMLAGFAMWMVLAPDRAVEIGTIQTSSKAAFTVSYEGDAEAPEAGTLAEGSRLRLSEGSMEGVLKNGIRFVAIAPMDMLVVSEDTMKLEQGRVWFEVSSSASGFTVKTAKLDVVDLGTEFGVVSAKDLGQEVHVFKGSVEVTVAG